MDAELPDRERSRVDAPKTEAKLVKWLLRIGLAASTLLMAAGLVVQLASEARLTIPVRLFEVASPAPLPLGERLMAIGIVVLAFTPALRVVALLGLWLQERDYRFAAVAVAVVLTLVLAIVVGGG